MTTLEGLLAMRELLAVPERWTTGTFARDREGFDCDEIKDSAYCYCLAGAFLRVTYGTAYPTRKNMRTVIEAALPLDKPSMASFNDAGSTTHTDVVALLDRAISSERAKAGA